MLRIIACHYEMKSCSIRNPQAVRVDMHLMQMPALAASPDHTHHTMANCARKRALSLIYYHEATLTPPWPINGDNA